VRQLPCPPRLSASSQPNHLIDRRAGFEHRKTEAILARCLLVFRADATLPHGVVTEHVGARGGKLLIVRRRALGRLRWCRLTLCESTFAACGMIVSIVG
jgi:hypothetical protein